MGEDFETRLSCYLTVRSNDGVRSCDSVLKEWGYRPVLEDWGYPAMSALRYIQSHCYTDWCLDTHPRRAAPSAHEGDVHGRAVLRALRQDLVDLVRLELRDLETEWGHVGKEDVSRKSF